VDKANDPLAPQLALAAKIKAGAVPNGFQIPGWTSEYFPFDYQQQGILWMYLTPRAILADVTGAGKTIQLLGLLTYLKSKGHISPKRRVIIIVPAISVYTSWKADGFDKFQVPLNYAIGRGTKLQRECIYNDPSWEVLLTNYETVRNDVDILEGLDFQHVIMDEVDYIKNHSTQAAKAVKRVTANAQRVIAVSATPIQNTLLDLHSILEALGLKSVFGSKTAFDRRYHEHVVEQIRTRSRTIYKKKVVGYKNTEELKKKLEPFYLRRTYNDINVEVPELKSQPRWVELTPEQKQMYEDVKRGFAKLSPKSPPKEIKAAALKLRQVCTSTASAGATFDSSAKFDWLIKTLTTDWADSKIVLFSNWKNSLAAFEKRLEAAGVGYVTVTSDDPDQASREVKRQKFWLDPQTRVFMGTTAIERSLNLQCANIQINLDMLYNPSRHQQLAGRVQRVGSEHKNAWVFSMMAKDTIEEHVMNILKQKQAISDHIFDDQSDVFEQLSTAELYKLIRS